MPSLIALNPADVLLSRRFQQEISEKKPTCFTNALRVSCQENTLFYSPPTDRLDKIYRFTFLCHYHNATNVEKS